MSRPPSRYIQLSEAQHQHLLTQLKHRDTGALETRRIMALLMSHAGSSIAIIERSGILSRKTLGLLLERFATQGVECVLERVHPGRSSAFTPEMQALVLQWVTADEQVWNCATLSEALQRETGVLLQPDALRLQLRKLNLSWQRTRYVVAGQPDPGVKALYDQHFEVLKRGRSRGSVAVTS